MSGQEVKALILGSGVKCWQVAYELGITETTFCRWLRRPFDEKAVNRVKAAIEKLLKAKEQQEK